MRSFVRSVPDIARKLFKQKEWQRRQFLSDLQKDGKPFRGESIITRQRRRAELRASYCKQFAQEYSGEPRKIRRAMALAIAKKIYRGMRAEEKKAA